MRSATKVVHPVVAVLDELDATDTVFHDLKHTSPLAAELLARIPAEAGHVLLVGPNIALAHVLLGRGTRVTLWHVQGVAITEDLVDKVTRRGSVDDLVCAATDGERFDVVVAPFVVELATPEPQSTLRSLGALVGDGGVLLLASSRAGGVQARLDGLRGRAALGRSELARSAPTWSWPSGPRRHVVDELLLTGWARAAGLRISEWNAVIDRLAVEEVSAPRLREFLAAKAAHDLKLAAPALRDTVVATLRPMCAGRSVNQLGSDQTTFPRTSVVVFSSSERRLETIVAHLENQTYPRDRTELVIVWPASLGPTPDIPGTLPRRELAVSAPVPSAAAANQALAATRGDIVAYTSDSCDIPPGWIESGVRELGGWTMAVAGRVLVQVQSAAAFLELPGRRRYPRPDGLFGWSNSFYVRHGLVEVGGFNDPDPAVDGGGRQGATWGWDTTAAVKLARRGYHVSESNQVYLHRSFPPAPDRRWMREEYEYARGIPLGIRWEPQLRHRALHRSWFASERTFAFDLMAVGLAASAVTGRRGPAVLGTLAYLRSISEYMDVWPPAAWSSTVRHLRGVTVRSAIWSAGLVRGSIAARRVVL